MPFLNLKQQKLAIAALVAIGIISLAVSFSITPANTKNLNNGDKLAIQKIVKDYLIENPEVIRDALQELERRNVEQEKQRQKKLISENRDLLINEKYSYNTGNLKGDITVVEFFDYNCGYCRQSLGEIVKLLEKDKNVRLVLKEYPILGESSQLAALAALASRKQGKYLEFHKALLATKGRITEAAIFDAAKNIKLDIEKMKTDMASTEIKDQLQKNIDVGMKLGVNGTPTFIINDQVIPQALPYQAMKDMIENLRKAS